MLSSRAIIASLTAFPILFGWLCLKGAQSGLYSPEIGFAMLMFAVSVLLGSIVLINARLRF